MTNRQQQIVNNVDAIKQLIYDSERWLWAGIGIFDFVYAGIISRPLWRKKN